MSDYLFSEHHRENRPLRGLLEEKSRTSYSRAASFRREDAERFTDVELVRQFLADWDRFAKPLYRVGDMRSVQEPILTDRVGYDSSVRVTYWRWIYRFPVKGNRELLDYWPKDLKLEPGDNNVSFEPTSGTVWQFGSEETVCAIIDVLQNEDPNGLTPPDARVVKAARYLNESIRIINNELEEFQQGLTDQLLDIVSERRNRLGVIAQNTARTIALVAREAPALTLVDLQTQSSDVPILVPEPVQIGDAEVKLDLVVTEGTFTDLVTYSQRWAESAQSYPGSFTQLDEDSITSLLIATLNVVFDTAQREVFKWRGKADIFVEHRRADRSRAAYVGEAKIWSGSAAVKEHFSQLLGRYSIEQLRQVLLVYYVKKKRIDVIRQNAVRAIGGLSIFREWKSVACPVIAIVSHPEFGHSVEVAILYVHIPPARSD